MNSRENMGALGSRIANMGQTLMQAAIRTGVAAGVSARPHTLRKSTRRRQRNARTGASITPGFC